MKSKTIILSSQKKFIQNSPRAILTLIDENNKTDGKLRLYNAQTLSESIKLGIYYDEKVYQANLNPNNGSWSFSIDTKFDLTQNIYCALIDTKNNNEVYLSGGTNNGFYFTDEIEDDESVKTNCEIYQEDNNQLSEDLKPETNIEKDESAQCCSNCTNCIYKDYFYSHRSNVKDNDTKVKYEEIIDCQVENTNDIESIENLEKDEEIESVEINKNNNNIIQLENLTEEEKENTNEVSTNSISKSQENKSQQTEEFLSSITEQLDEMFKEYPQDEIIMSIIPNSKIIKVTDSLDNSSYIVGIIYENQEIRYLLYGVPAKYNETAPSELGDNYQWLPLDPDDPISDGYFLIYQDATNGKIVPIKVE